jgi:hypothetical protein
LEGFDDPFTTLQMVAEYFRKLAAEDRYFGGVPQVPDADALTRIAEENTPGAIATEVAENGIILRQTDTPKAEVEVEAELEDNTQTEEHVAANLNAWDDDDDANNDADNDNDGHEYGAHDEDRHDDGELNHAIPDQPALDQSVMDTDEEVALETDTTTDAQTDRAATELAPDLAKTPHAEAPQDEIDTDEIDVETVAEAVAEIETPEVEAAAPDSIALDTVTPEQEAPKAPTSLVTFFRSRRHEEQDAKATEPENTQQETSEADSSDADTDDDLQLNITPFSHRETTSLRSVEETLAAIRQTVERAETDLDVRHDDTPAHDEYDGDEYDGDASLEAETDTVHAGNEAQTTLADPQNLAPQGGAFSDPLVLTHEDQADDLTEPLEDETSAVEQTTTLADVEPDATLHAETDAESVTEPDAAPTNEVEVDVADEDEADEVVTDELDAKLDEIQALEVEPASTSSSLSDEQEAELNRDLAEALDLETDAPTGEAETDAINADATDEIAHQTADEITEETPEDMSTAPSEALTESAFEDPQVEDSQVEAQVDEEEQRRQERRARAHALRNSVGYADEEDALDRLLQATQSKMDKPEQARRLNALEQLKAAVAATEAEAKLSVQDPDARTEDDTTDLDTYRDDLRRAQSKARLGGLVAPPKPAATPLILVSEQRIDEQPAVALDDAPQREVAETHGNLALKPEPELENLDSPADDLRENEIQGIPADAFSEATNFADFAERIGAFELQDLLEASAAYTSIVEGKSRFSRAQIMSKIAKIDSNGAFTKEAGLRSFGRLLREGKILRVQDGQFAISKASRFSIASRFE